MRRIKVYVRLGAILAVALAGLLVVLMNLSRRADVWFFHDYRQVPTFWLILVTGVMAVAGWWSFRKVVSVMRELRGLREAKEAQRQREAQHRLAAELAEREKRIDEKLRRSISDG